MKKKEESSSEGLLNLLKSKYAKSNFSTANSIQSLERFSSGVVGIDCLLGGGWPVGRVVELAGKESAGKSAISLKACISEIESGYMALYQDLEQTVTKEYLEYMGVKGEAARRFICNVPTYGEEAVDIGLAAAADEGVRLIVTDSVPFMMPKTVLDKLEDDSAYNPSAMSQAAMFNRLKQNIVTGLTYSNSCWLFINQIRDNTNSIYGGVHSPGGHTLAHLYSIRMQITHTSLDADKPGLIKSHIKTTKNKTFTPGLNTEIPIYKGKVQVGQSLVIEGVKVGLVVKSGSWYSIENEFRERSGLELSKLGQGEEKAGKAVEEDLKAYGVLYQEIMKRHIDKYCLKLGGD